ncbi:Gonadotropin inhibitory hormone peptide [Varanus komodoensis]|nr:Gonadotropin inhibitory hormone peptide [Varanus komodoensis]
MNTLILFTLVTTLLSASKTICLDGSLMPNLQSKEEYNEDNYYESSEDIIKENQRSVDLEELKHWELQNFMKMTTPTGKKVPDSVANLPLRYDSLKTPKQRDSENEEASLWKSLDQFPF